MDRVTIFCGEDGGYRWKRRSETGDLLETCAESYPDLDAVRAATRAANPGLPARLSAALALSLSLADDKPPTPPPVEFLAAPEFSVVSDPEVDAEARE